MAEFYQNVTYLGLITLSVGVVGAILFSAVRCFQMQSVLIGLGVLATVPIWFGLNLMVVVFHYASATPNPATPANFAEYAVLPVYAAFAGLVCYVLFRVVKNVEQSTTNKHVPVTVGETLPSAQAEVPNLTYSDSLNQLRTAALDGRKIAGIAFVVLGAAVIATWFFVPGVLFIVVGISLLMDVQIWRS